MTTTTTFRNTTTRRRPDGSLAPVRPHEVTVKRATPITPAPTTIAPMVDPGLDPMSGRPTGDLSADEWARYADLWHARADKAEAAGPSDRVNAALYRRRAEICEARGKADFQVLLNPNGKIANATPIDTYEGPRWAVYPARDTARSGKPRFINPDGKHAAEGWRTDTKALPAWAEVVMSTTTQTALLRTYPVNR
ncbi:hypothetical protein DVS28_b0576 (plasmid) [Euzebya pacifica]|uniref:Uncharacterized protein n=1 Tax=Euzebya pacifica TaxID=1608957 RepID=A0A346Y769_9ACTN|nr:hypothetical protein [Euzebya pacifica]AXV10316.1 hypothetical protein DVS28_b0576 [Euzebya pacifica]